MNDFSVIIFLVISLSLLGGALWLMWSAGTSKPVSDFNTGRLSGEWTTEVKKAVHPEMKDVEPGTELMGVNFTPKTECDLDEYKDLQARIEILRAELEGEDDEEDDDDGGDVVIGRR